MQPRPVHEAIERVPPFRGRLLGREELQSHARGVLGHLLNFLLRLALDRLAALEADLGRLEAYVDEKLKPYRAAQRGLMEVPGIGAQTAAAIVSPRFPSSVVEVVMRPRMRLADQRWRNVG